MTDPADYAPSEQLLPGLAEPARTASQLEIATRRSIVALEAQGLVDERHAMILQLLIDLAKVIDRGRLQGKASAAAMAAAQMLAAYQLLLPEAEGGGEDGDAFDQLAADLRGAAAGILRDVGDVAD